MVRLNRAQLLKCWEILFLISLYILGSGFQREEYYVFESEKNPGVYEEVPARIYGPSERIDDTGKRYIVPWSLGPKYYFVRTRGEAGIEYLYERLILITALNGLLLLYTLWSRKQNG